jgi:peptide-methionine (R)-S-oxide reductase
VNGRRRRFLLEACALCAASAARPLYANDEDHEIPASFPPLERRDLPWHELLEPERFEVLFLQETEFPGSSPLNDEHRNGTYICAACYLPLFRSRHKYDSGTGWPSFTQPIEGHIETRVDGRGREPIVEYHCKRCGGHQGHVFRDGPPPRGERWCNNGLALIFVPREQPLPPLRK